MKHTSSAKSDPRWHILSLVQTSHERFGIKARSLTVLRGLLSFVNPAHWNGGALQVFPSNRALQERCDGMDERTLRRHIAHLCKAGLIDRRLSPNRKRYVVRGENGTPVLCYGFDLSALKHHVAQLEDWAAEAKRETAKIRLLRAVLRDLMWKTHSSDAELRKLLRNKTTTEVLENAVENLRKSADLTDNDGQTDRHIQNHNKEYIEETTTAMNPQAVTAAECIEAAKDAISLSPEPINDWPQLHHLAHTLAPGLGINQVQQEQACETLGYHGYILAIFGMVQSIGRIKNAPQYLNALTQKAAAGSLNFRKMFTSLTNNKQFPAGNRNHQRLSTTIVNAV